MMDRNLALEAVRVTEAAALASARTVGLGDEKLSDQAAVEAMRGALNRIDMKAKIVIGEGERDEAPMLFIGEMVGTGQGPDIEIAVDPLEGTTICAHGLPNAISVVAIAESGGFLHAPDVYMKKIAVGADAVGVIDITQSATWNLERIAKAKGKRASDLTVVCLNRPRHEDLIREIRSVGARICLIQDGDVSAAIAAASADSGVDVLLGTGGAPEGVIAAAAIRCTGGDFQGQLLFRNDDERARATKMGIRDLERFYRLEDLARGDVMMAATGITTGTLLPGVTFRKNGATTHSIVMRSATGTIRHMTAHHRFDIKPYIWGRLYDEKP